jgi:hypothetical protein
MKKVLLFLFTLLFISCANQQQKSMSELKKESLEKGINNDTIFGNLRFGILNSEVYKILGIYNWEEYRFNVPDIKHIKWSVTPEFYNDSLYKIRFFPYTAVMNTKRLLIFILKNMECRII